MSDTLVRYHFRDAIGGFFEFPTESARTIIPTDLQPVEPHPGSSVLSIMVFDFHDSPVGEYRELILSVLVAPRIEPGNPMPRSAFYPFLLGTTTRSSREHAIERWRLPHYMHDIDIGMARRGSAMHATASHNGAPILEMRITEYEWREVQHRYQSFMADEEGAYSATIIMAGKFSENEEERGHVVLHPHAFTEGMDCDGVTTTPFRELWMQYGLQTFYPLQTLARYARR